MTSGKTSILVNAAHLGSARILGISARGIYVILLARELGAELYGTYAYGQAWYLVLMPFAMLGMQQALGVEIGKNRPAASRLAGCALSLRLLGSLTVGLLSAMAAWAWHTDDQVIVIIWLFSLALAGRNLATWAEHVLVATEASRYVLRQEVLFRPLEAALGILILFGGGGLFEVVFLHTAVWWVQAAMGFRLVRRQVGSVLPQWDPEFIRRFLRSAAFLVPIGFAVGWVWQGPLLLFRPFADSAEAVGYLGFSIQVLSLLQFLPSSLAAAALPLLSRSAARGDGKDLAFLSLGLRLTLLGGGALGLTLLVLAEPLILLVLPRSYAPAAPLLALGSVVFTLYAAILLCTDVLIARELKAKATTIALAASSLVAAGVVPFVKWLGTYGVLTAMILGQLFWLLALFAVLKNRAGFSPLSHLGRPAVACAIALAAYALAPLQPMLSFLLSLSFLMIASIVLSVVSSSEWRTIFLRSNPDKT